MAKGRGPGWSAGIACPKCGVNGSIVKDSREAPHNQIRRRRECENGHRFTTYENVDDDGAEG